MKPLPPSAGDAALLRRARARHEPAAVARPVAEQRVEGPKLDRGPAPLVRADAKRPSRELDPAALQQALTRAPFFAAKEPVRGVDVVAQQELPSTEPGARHLLVTVKARLDDGRSERWLLPVRVDASGALDVPVSPNENGVNVVASPAFAEEMLAAVTRGDSFEPPAAAHRSARRRPGDVRGPVGARLAKARVDKAASAPKAAAASGESGDVHAQASALARAIYDGDKSAPWGVLLAEGITTRERFEFVTEQAKKLSPKDADALVVAFFQDLIAAKQAQPAEVRAFHEALATRPRFSPVFYTYPQGVSAGDGSKPGTLADMGKALDIVSGDASGPLRSMVRGAGFGFHAVELLPLFLSPQKDGGYDITDHREVAPELGGNEAFASMMNKAVERGIRVTADLVANHVAGDHAWAKALEAGDESMVSRFVVWDDAVKVGERVVDDKTFNVFLHTKGENAGKVSHVWQIFPDNNPDTFINAAGHKIFASFMNPYQWDVNLADPKVLSYYLETLAKFANLGQMGTRMDAIIHSGKTPGTFNINNEESQAFMALAKSFVSHLVPGNIFLPEANLPWDEAKREWLMPEQSFDGKVENTAGDVLISFDVHRAIWDSLLKGDKTAFMKAQAELGDLPPHKSLLVYLGLHDETLIEDPALRKALLARDFHDFAGRGVGDAPAELLDHDDARLAMAHVLLYSSKGHPAVYYRTLVGAGNNEKYYEAKTKDRLADQEKAGEKPDLQKARDTRDLDRGTVALADYDKALASGFKPAVTVRALNALWDRNGAVRTNDVTELKNPNASVMSVARRSTETDDKPLLQLINLSGKEETVSLKVADLEKQLGWKLDGAKLSDLLAAEIDGGKHPVPFTVDGDTVKLTLEPYQCFYLQRDG